MKWHFMSIHDFIAMGGYAKYVWSAYGIALIALLGLFITSGLANKKQEELNEKAS